ncbi:unnamed protein product, partial [Allacma fusca]
MASPVVVVATTAVLV